MSPIRPENRERYPADWSAISLAIKERGGWRCECLGECGTLRPKRRECRQVGGLVTRNAARDVHRQVSGERPLLAGLSLAHVRPLRCLISAVSAGMIGSAPAFTGQPAMHGEVARAGRPHGVGLSAQHVAVFCLGDLIRVSMAGDSRSMLGAVPAARLSVLASIGRARIAGSSRLGLDRYEQPTAALLVVVRLAKPCPVFVAARLAAEIKRAHAIHSMPSANGVMCNGCHLHYDRDHHKQTAAATRRAAQAARGQVELWVTGDLGGAA